MTRSNKISLVGSEAIRAIQFIQLVIHSTKLKKNQKYVLYSRVCVPDQVALEICKFQ